MSAWVFTWGEVYRLMGSITEDHKSKVSPPRGTALPSCLKAEHEERSTRKPKGKGSGRQQRRRQHGPLQHLQGFH